MLVLFFSLSRFQPRRADSTAESRRERERERERERGGREKTRGEMIFETGLRDT